MMSSVSRLSLCVLLLGICIGALKRGAFAQKPSNPTDESGSVPQNFQTGFELVSTGSASEAIAPLRSVFREAPGYHSQRHGSVAYWLGMAYASTGQSSEAERVWKAGVDALADDGIMAPRLADRYLQSVLAGGTLRGEMRSAAADVYRYLLRAAGSTQTNAGTEILRRRVAQITLLMPDPKAAKVLERGTVDEPESWTLAPDAGSYLLRWWRAQDPIPKTPENERLEEHLSRLAYAQTNYHHRERATNLDDRGHAYLSFGTPYRTEHVTFSEFSFHEDVFRFGVPVTQSDFPDNEVWLYHNIDRMGYYIFVRQSDGTYELGRAHDLIPPRLRRATGKTDRQVNIAVSGLAAMRHVYKQLAQMQGVFGPFYSRLNDYILRQEEKSIQRSLGVAEGHKGQTKSVGEGRTARTVTEDPSSGLRLPTRTLQATLDASAQAEEQAESARKESMPESHSSLLANTPQLPVVTRTARFLADDRTTDVEVYWALPSGALSLPESTEDQVGASTAASVLLDFTGVAYDDDYRRREATRDLYRIKRPSTASGRVLAPQKHRISGKDSSLHLDLQWEQRLNRGPDPQPGPLVKITTTRVDSLKPLNADPARLEVSDLRPMSWLGTDAEQLKLDAARPHPFAVVKEDTPFVLYFEVYDLVFDENDRTQYTVEYTLQRRTEEGGLDAVFGDEDKTRTATTTSYSGDARNTQEYIILDWGDQEVTEEEKVSVVVTVTDDVSKQTVVRKLNLRLVPSDS